MLKTRKQTTISGESIITENGVEITIATMFASRPDNGKLNNNITIINEAKYGDYSEEVNADIAEFNAEATKLIKGV